MYTLFKERWYLDNTVHTKHEVEKEYCATLEIARENMLYDFDRIAGTGQHVCLRTVLSRRTVIVKDSVTESFNTEFCKEKLRRLKRFLFFFYILEDTK